MVIFGRKIDMLHELKQVAGLLIGSMIYSYGLNLFLVPNHIIDGGVTGISLLFSELFGISFSILIVALNIPFLMTSPMPKPIRMPPKMAERKGSVVTGSNVWKIWRFILIGAPLFP